MSACLALPTSLAAAKNRGPPPPSSSQPHLFPLRRAVEFVPWYIVVQVFGDTKHTTVEWVYVCTMYHLPHCT